MQEHFCIFVEAQDLAEKNHDSFLLIPTLSETCSHTGFLSLRHVSLKIISTKLITDFYSMWLNDEEQDKDEAELYQILNIIVLIDLEKSDRNLVSFLKLK